MQDIKVYTDSEVAVLLKLHVSTVRKWRGTGMGPKYHKAGDSVRYSHEDIMQYLRETTVEPTPRA